MAALSHARTPPAQLKTLKDQHAEERALFIMEYEAKLLQQEQRCREELRRLKEHHQREIKTIKKGKDGGSGEGPASD